MATLQSLTVNDTANLTLPIGTSANRPTINSTVVSFTTVGTTTWTAPTGVTSVEVLVVAGGGGGGYEMGGGGGGGGVLYNSAFPVTPTTVYTVTVGGGGTGRTTNSDNTNNAGNSVFSTITAIGGGAGGCNSNPYNGTATGGRPTSGGSGGGSGENSSNGRIDGAPGTFGQGFAGGGAIEAPRYQSGGGGGAGGPGKTAVAEGFGDGGPGFFSRISGAPAFYGGGGGGGIYISGTPGKGGIGGGGAAGAAGTVGAAGTANTGGGGGGGSYSPSSAGGAGGSGIVIIRYSLTSESTLPTAQTRFSTATGALETYNTNNQWNPQAVGNNIETHGLVLYVDSLRYASGSATWPDLSGRNNNMTVVGSPSYSAATGFTFPAAQTTQYIILNPFSDMPTVGGTFEMWVKTPGGSSIMSYASTAADNNMLLFGTTGIGVYGPSGAIGSDVNIANDQWTHLVRTSNRNTGEELLYVNGELRFRATHAVGELFTAGGSLVLGQEQDAIGGAFDAGQSMTGSFAVVRVYSRALSKDEITRNFNAESSRFQKYIVPKTPQVVTGDLAIYVDAANPASFIDRQNFNTTWYDIGGPGNNGTLTGGAVYSTATSPPSILFDGVDDRITFNSYLVPGVARSFFIWVRYTSLTHSSGYQLMGTQEGNAYTYIGIVNGGNIYYYAGASTGGDISGTAVTANTWVNLGFVLYPDGFRVVYKNGVPVFSTTGGIGATATAAFTLGAINNNHYLTGYLSAAQLYLRPLSAAEVMQNFAALRYRHGI